MAGLEHIRKKISEIAKRTKNVQLSEIQWVVDQLEKNGYRTACKKNDHQHVFSVNGKYFGVCHHNPGGKQIKACYVKKFLETMIDLELHDEN
jgi:hypothetical protein